MGRELPPTATPVLTPDAWAALGRAYLDSRGVAPSRETLACLTAQWALETGWGKHMRCFNIGNVKATDRWEGDFAFFATSERLSPAAGAAAVAKAGQRTDGSGPDVSIPDGTLNKAGKVRVLFFPSHRACKFRAFASLDEGAAAQVRTLTTDFATTLPALESGSPDAWARALSRARYYTADPDIYAAELTEIHADLMRRGLPVPGASGSGNVPPAPPAPPTPTSPSGSGLVLALLGLGLALSGGRL